MTPILALALFASVSPVKVTVDGDGYLRFMRSGRVVYAKTASLTCVDGKLGADGAFVLPAISIPEGATSFTVDLSGEVTAVGPAGSNDVGRLVLALFSDRLKPRTEGRFFVFEGRPTLGNPGEDSDGVIRSDSKALPNSPWQGGSSPLASPPRGLPAPKRDGTPASHHQIPTVSTPQVEIIVHTHSEVSGDNFTLGDVATIKASDEVAEKYKAIKIGATAIAGSSRLINRNYVSLRILGAGFHDGDYVLVVPDGAEVSRKTKSILPDDLLAVAVDAVQAKTGLKGTFHLMGSVRAITCPYGDIRLDASDPEQTKDGFAVTVTARLDDRIVGTRTVTLTPSAESAGVKAGDPVSVVLKSGSATVEVTGKATTGGFLGQRIQVTIAGVGATTTTHVGLIVGPGKVEVEL